MAKRLKMTAHPRLYMGAEEKVDIAEKGNQIVVQVGGRNWERDIVLSKQLRMVKG